MSLNISDSVNATSQQGLACSTTSPSQILKRPSSQMPGGADATPTQKILAEQPDNPLIRAHPTASTYDSLQRLPEVVEANKYKSRIRKGAAERGDETDAQPAAPPQKMRSPYDPRPATQRDFDLLA